MTQSRSRWIPIALCCVPGIAAVILLAGGAAVGGTAFRSGPLAVGLTALALLACPLTMGLMMKRKSKHQEMSAKSAGMADFCSPGEPLSTIAVDRLAALRTQREALEREVAQLQAR